MKIAILAPVMVEIPPKKYGGTQLMIYEMALGLAKKGHQITVFCSAGSRIAHKNIKVVESSPHPMIDFPELNRHWESRQMITALSCQNEFDLVHFFYEPAVCDFEIAGKSLNLMSFFRIPVISSFRNLTNIKKYIEYYKINKARLKNITKVFLSQNQKSPLRFLDNLHVVYNGLNIKRYVFKKDKSDYVIFLGRITREKGILDAIKAARNAGSKLVIAAKICREDKQFYDEQVKQHIDGKIIKYVGEVDFAGKNRYLSEARALLLPIHWDEPFGIVVAEAMACGTPVIVYGRGAMPELIINGTNGFIAKDVDDMAKKIVEIGSIKPKTCRYIIEKRFSSLRMVEEYEKIYHDALEKFKKTAKAKNGYM